MMQWTEHGVLQIVDEDISSLYCYHDRDGMGYDDSFLFELQLQNVSLTPGSVSAIQFVLEEESPLREGIIEDVQTAIRSVDTQYNGSIVK
ncbi:hypothetical protein ACFTRD_28960 [Paenibacillus sp. NPDC056933]|uniref:hypothetical protein n=1 Tax=Paenibacillus sp. NPDC056933 TaxID=3345968 RepID=UPI00362D0D3F